MERGPPGLAQPGRCRAPHNPRGHHLVSPTPTGSEKGLGRPNNQRDVSSGRPEPSRARTPGEEPGEEPGVQAARGPALRRQGQTPAAQQTCTWPGPWPQPKPRMVARVVQGPGAEQGLPSPRSPWVDWAVQPTRVSGLLRGLQKGCAAWGLGPGQVSLCGGAEVAGSPLGRTVRGRERTSTPGCSLWGQPATLSLFPNSQTREPHGSQTRTLKPVPEPSACQQGRPTGCLKGSPADTDRPHGRSWPVAHLLTHGLCGAPRQQGHGQAHFPAPSKGGPRHLETLRGA